MPGKVYQGVCCTKCKNFRSVKNAVVNVELRGETGSDYLRSFFASVSIDGKSRTKVSIRTALAIMYFWEKDLLLLQTKDIVRRQLSTQSNNTLNFRRPEALHSPDLTFLIICICSGYNMLFS